MRHFKALLPAFALSLALSCSAVTLAAAQDETAAESYVEDTDSGVEAAEEDAPDVDVPDAEAVDSRPIRSLRSEALGATDATVAAAAVAELETRAATDAEAALALGEVYVAGGETVPRDLAAAIPFLETAAAAGEASAYKRLGDIYRSGETLADPFKAYENYKAAADLGDATGAYRAGDYLRAGEVVPRDMDAAIAYYRIAAEGGNTASLMRLGDAYRGGEADGLNPADSIPWYEQAGEAGNAQAFYRLGELYRQGVDGAPQPDRAVAYYERAIAGENNLALMRLARGLLNESLAQGRAAEGYAMLQRANEQGIPGAAIYLADAQIKGLGTSADVPAGLATLNAAAEAGDISAARNLIQLLTRGVSGQRPNIAEARRVLDRLSTTAEPDIAAYETTVVLTAERAGFPAIGDSFETIEADTKPSLLNRVYGLDRNAYVYLLQRRLTEIDLYSGALNGLMTGSTISALNRLCAANDIVSTCRMGPLSSRARTAIAEVIFK